MFRLPLKAERWFSNIKHHFSFEFDMYYYCVLAGLVKGVKQLLPSSDTKELIRSFPQDYRSESKIIVAYFLTKELEKQGISLNDRAAVHSLVKRYIDSESLNAILSEEGMRELNNYANGGIEVLENEFGHKPENIETFLLRFSKFISKSA